MIERPSGKDPTAEGQWNVVVHQQQKEGGWL